MSPGIGSAISIGSNTGNVPSISANGGTVTPIAPLNGDLSEGSWTDAIVGSFHLTGAGEGDTQQNAIVTEIPNETQSNPGTIVQTFTATGSGTVETFTTVGYQPFVVGDLVSPASCGSYDGGSEPVTAVTSTTFTVNGSTTGSQPGCIVSSPSYETRASNVVTMRIYPQPFTSASIAITIAGCADASFNSAIPITLSAVATGSITFPQSGANASTSACAPSGGTVLDYLAKITPNGAMSLIAGDTSIAAYPIVSHAGASGSAHIALAGQAPCTMDATASGVAGEPVVADVAECEATATPGAAYVIGHMVSNSTTAGATAMITLGAGYVSGSAASSWSSLTGATTNLLMNNGAFSTEFDQSVPDTWTWANVTASTSTVNQNSPVIVLQGTNWSGATPANAADSWTMQNLTGSGANPVSILSITHSGSSTATWLTSSINVPGGSLDDYYGGLRLSSTTVTLNSAPSNSINFQIGGSTVAEILETGFLEGLLPGFHILADGANNDISGTVAISAATSATHTFATAYTATTPPVCSLTPSSDPTAVGAYWVTVTGSSGSWTGVTANVHTSGTITFNYYCRGNPN